MSPPLHEFLYSVRQQLEIATESNSSFQRSFDNDPSLALETIESVFFNNGTLKAAEFVLGLTHLHGLNDIVNAIQLELARVSRNFSVCETNGRRMMDRAYIAALGWLIKLAHKEEIQS